MRHFCQHLQVLCIRKRSYPFHIPVHTYPFPHPVPTCTMSASEVFPSHLHYILVHNKCSIHTYKHTYYYLRFKPSKNMKAYTSKQTVAILFTTFPYSLPFTALPVWRIITPLRAGTVRCRGTARRWAGGRGARGGCGRGRGDPPSQRWRPAGGPHCRPSPLSAPSPDRGENGPSTYMIS